MVSNEEFWLAGRRIQCVGQGRSFRNKIVILCLFGGRGIAATQGGGLRLQGQGIGFEGRVAVLLNGMQVGGRRHETGAQARTGGPVSEAGGGTGEIIALFADGGIGPQVGAVGQIGKAANEGQQFGTGGGGFGSGLGGWLGHAGAASAGGGVARASAAGVSGARLSAGAAASCPATGGAGSSAGAGRKTSQAVTASNATASTTSNHGLGDDFLR